MGFLNTAGQKTLLLPSSLFSLHLTLQFIKEREHLKDLLSTSFFGPFPVDQFLFSVWVAKMLVDGGAYAKMRRYSLENVVCCDQTTLSIRLEKNDILSFDSSLQVSCQTSSRRAEGLPLISSHSLFLVGCPIQNASQLLTPVSDAVLFILLYVVASIFSDGVLMTDYF